MAVVPSGGGNLFDSVSLRGDDKNYQKGNTFFSRM